MSSINQYVLARELGVSQRAVSFALSGRKGVSADTRSRIVALAKSRGYRPSSAARTLSTRKTQQVGVLLHAVGNYPVAPHAFEFVAGINAVLEPEGYTTCLVQLCDVENEANGMARVFREQALDGMIVCASLQDAVRERVGELVERIIWCDAGVRDGQGCLWRDEFEAGRLAARAVSEGGYDRVLWVASAPTRRPFEVIRKYPQAEERLSGFVEALGSRADVRECRIGDMPFRDADALLGPLERGMAVVASDYSHAESVLALSTAAGLTAGHAFGLACCDDINRFHVNWANLARATYERFEVGRRAARMMLRRLADPASDVPSHVERPAWDGGGESGGPLAPTLRPRAELDAP